MLTQIDGRAQKSTPNGFHTDYHIKPLLFTLCTEHKQSVIGTPLLSTQIDGKINPKIASILHIIYYHKEFPLDLDISLV